MWFWIIAAVWLFAFDGVETVQGWFNGGTSSEWDDRGYDDGFAVGWESICGGSSIIYGEWANDDYANAFYEGEYAGKKEAKKRKCE